MALQPGLAMRYNSCINGSGLAMCSNRWLPRISLTLSDSRGSGVVWQLSRSATMSTPGSGKESRLIQPGRIVRPQPR